MIGSKKVQNRLTTHTETKRNVIISVGGLTSEARSFSAHLPADLVSAAVGLERLNPLLVAAACGVLAPGLICRVNEEL